MIDRQTIDRILEAAPIEQVIGEFVSLKRRGANYLACCPFHQEKTPSFSVSPAKGLYKCFGCGKAGNVVNFIMEHEQLGYVEALRYLGKRYNIPVDEKEENPEERAQRLYHESLFVVNDFARQHFTQCLWEDPLGRSVGLAYFRERGFTDNTLRTFQLGYAPATRDGFTQKALAQGFKLDYLKDTGLTLHYEADENRPEALRDRFNDRVMFPIHSLSGRVLGFGGRILRKDKQVAKYLNSPESAIYHKSRTLYGIYLAKQHITRLQNCYLVEGYTDVLSLWQAGVQNVVASSGTSLTTEQIRLIKRFSPRVTVLYDGDFAGIKASIRGIDMLLAEGLEVKVVLFPDGEDPDSFARSRPPEELTRFLHEAEEDFIRFKLRLTAPEIAADPMRRAQLIRDVVQSISVVPDAITRSVYIEQCADTLRIEEGLLAREVAGLRKGRILKERTSPEAVGPRDRPSANPTSANATSASQVWANSMSANLPTKEEEESVACRAIERDLLYYLLQFGQKPYDEPQEGVEPCTVARFIRQELEADELDFQIPFHKTVYEAYFALGTGDDEACQAALINHGDPEVARFVLSLVGQNQPLTIRQYQESLIPEEIQLKTLVTKAVAVFKATITGRACQEVAKRIRQLQAQPRGAEPGAVEALLKQLQVLTKIKNTFARELRRLNV